MITSKIQGQIIHAGYPWSVRIKMTGMTLPDTATFTAMVRRAPGADDLLATMTTANSGVVWIDAQTIELHLTGVNSATWPERKAYIDVVRTDVDPDVHMGFMLIVPVRLSITRGL